MNMDDFYVEGNTLIKYKGNETHVIVPDGIRIIGRQAFTCRSTLLSVVLPEGVVTIGEQAFDSCYNLEKVVIPSTVTLIEKSAFAACRSLDNVVIPNGVPYIAFKTFVGCLSLKKVTIPDSVTVIGEFAFNRCFSLTEVTLGDNVTEIGEDAFSYCRNLRAVSIGKGAEVIRWNTFAYCEALEKVAFKTGLREIVYGAFDNCPAIRDVYFDGDADAWKQVTVARTKNTSLLDASFHFGYTKPITGAARAKEAARAKAEAEAAHQISFDILADLPSSPSDEKEISALSAEHAADAEPTPAADALPEEEDEAQIRMTFDRSEESETEKDRESAPSGDTVPAVSPEKESASSPEEVPPVSEEGMAREDKSDSANGPSKSSEVSVPQPEPSAAKRPEKRRAMIRTTPKAALSDVSEEFRAAFYKSYLSLLPEAFVDEQRTRAEKMTEENIETQSEALFLVPAEEAYEFGCLCLTMGRYNLAFRAFLAAAGKGNLPSQYYVGCCFLWGIDTTKKIVDAARWLTKCKNDARFGEEARRLLAIVDAELEKPENAGLKVKRGNK